MAKLPNLQTRKSILFGLASGTTEFAKLPTWISDIQAYEDVINSDGNTPVGVASKAGTLGKFPEKIRTSHLMFENRRNGIPLLEAIKYCPSALTDDIINDNFLLHDFCKSGMARTVKYAIDRVDWHKLQKSSTHIKNKFLEHCTTHKKLDVVKTKVPELFSEPVLQYNNLLHYMGILGGLKHVPEGIITKHIDDLHTNTPTAQISNIPTPTSTQYGSVFWVCAANGTLSEIPQDLITPNRMQWKHPGCNMHIFSLLKDKLLLNQFSEIEIPESLFPDINPEWLELYISRRKLTETKQETGLDLF